MLASEDRCADRGGRLQDERGGNSFVSIFSHSHQASREKRHTTGGENWNGQQDRQEREMSMRKNRAAAIVAAAATLVLVETPSMTARATSTSPTRPRVHLTSALNMQATAARAAANTLTPEEERDGWTLLFDGTSTDGWRAAYGDTFPQHGWAVENGELVVLESGGGESKHGGDIVTVDQYSSFEVMLDVKLTPGANSGIKYFVTEQQGGGGASAIGLEYQLLDDERHPDAKAGRPGTRMLASLYDLIPAEDRTINPPGEWNTARIVSRDRHVEHWLNGTKVLEYERGSAAYRKLVAESKYAKWESFGEADKGRILLQDHGNRVAFRNIKVRVLP
ncbi:MAG: DUF1080 domain-containing protein [Luteitalea sp.]|nr:DUF1080 domain-containing protein [Luteitalea sp.]